MILVAKDNHPGILIKGKGYESQIMMDPVASQQGHCKIFVVSFTEDKKWNMLSPDLFIPITEIGPPANPNVIISFPERT